MTESLSESLELDYGIHYRVWHDESDEHVGNMARWTVEGIDELLPSNKESRILDIGCGMGFAMLGLKSIGFKAVSGIDIDRSQVESAQKRGLEVVRVSNTLKYLEERPNCYDTVLMLDVLEHIPVEQQISYLRAIFSTLSPGGRIILQVPNANSPVAVRWRYIDFTHTSSFTEHSLSYTLANGGFVNIAVPMSPDPGFPRIPRRFWNKTYRSAFFTGFRRWLMRYAWRQLFIAEIGTGRGQDNISMAYNLVAVGFKPSDLEG